MTKTFTGTNEQLKAAQEAFDKAAPRPLGMPETGQEYWFIGVLGELRPAVWDDGNFDNKVFAIGNCYLSQALCEHAIAVRKATAILYRVRDELGGRVTRGEYLRWVPLFGFARWFAVSTRSASDYSFDTSGQAKEFIARCSAELTIRYSAPPRA